jgi:pimeloyl-ACP methyl ester carboxylesterase
MCSNVRVMASAPTGPTARPHHAWLTGEAGVSLHYLEWRRTAPGVPLVLLHGLSSNARYWQRVVDRLPSRRAVALDQRAHGLSPVPEDGLDEATLVDDVLRLVDACRLQRPVVVGHSFGAAVALSAAAAHPDRFSGLGILDGPVWPRPDTDFEALLRRAEPPLPAHATLRAALADSARYLGPAWGPDLEPFVRAGLHRSDGTWRLTLTAPARRALLRFLFDQPVAELWSRVRVPTTVVLATRGLGARPGALDAVAAITAGAPSRHIRLLEGPHDVPLSDPAAVAGELAWLCAEADPDRAAEGS